MSQVTALAFEEVDNWERRPPGLDHLDIADVAVDATDRVYLLARYPTQVCIYESDGTFVKAWGLGAVHYGCHGIGVGPDGSVFIADRLDHSVRKYSNDGEELLLLGTPGVPSETGVDWSLPMMGQMQSIRFGGPPFGGPTKIAVRQEGDFYISDGYWNARIHHFAKDGTLIESWGQPGTGPVQFNTAHYVTLTLDNLLLVCDRANDRVQLLTPEGSFVREFVGLQRPTGAVIAPDGLIYVSEMETFGPNREVNRARISVLDRDGLVVHRFVLPDVKSAPNGLAVDSKGAMYVAETPFTMYEPAGLSRAYSADHDPMPPAPDLRDYRELHKFRRVLGAG